MNIIFPQPLKKGDRVALLSPASAVKEEYVYGAMTRIMERGYEAVMMPHALECNSGSYSATKDDRLWDILEALEDPSIKAIFCNRGGYGCVHLLPSISHEFVNSNPKWISGFSDVSALLALWYKSGVASIHGPMAKHLATEPADDFCSETLFKILESGGKFEYKIPADTYNRQGKTIGCLRGGNFAVLNGLAATPLDLLKVFPDENVILFFEDINEPIYSIERMLWRLYLAGTLNAVKGLIFGQFTDYKPDRNFQSVEEMISHWLERNLMIRDIPVVFNFPIGHVLQNYPLTVGATVELNVTNEFTRIKTIIPS